MNPNPKGIFLQVLNIIGYSDDKEKFSNQFFQLCEQQTISDLIQSLAQDKQTSLQTELSSQTNIQSNNSLLKKYFTEEQIANFLQKATEKTFSSYLQTIIPTLSNQKKSELESYLTSLTPS